jgi:beta-glucosidase
MSIKIDNLNDPTDSLSARVSDLIGRMTLEEKVAQTMLVAVNHIETQAIGDLGIGAILSGGGANPEPNNPANWLAMVDGCRQAALQSRLGIPILYGVDAVHGHNNMRGAVIYPHNIGLGAARDADLVRRIGRATAVETYVSGVRWDFAPTLAVPQDIRWGRTFEGFGEDTALVSELGRAYIEGLQGDDPAAEFSVLATAKHYFADGGTTYGTAEFVFPVVPELGVMEEVPFLVDQGDTRLDEATLRKVHLAPYLAALRAGVLTVMASFSKWNGVKLHAHHYLLTELLKEELGFPGFVVSDWEGVRDSHLDPYTAVVTCYNAGIDMNMVSFGWHEKMELLHTAVQKGDVSLERLEDAVCRILTVKLRAGLFEQLESSDRYLPLIGSSEHRALAREAVVKSAVLLKNEKQTLPLPQDAPRILVAGAWADDIGLQCGGWTIAWQGEIGPITSGTTILEGLRAQAGPEMVIDFEPDGRFDGERAAYGIVCVGETPYAEGLGDRANLALDADQAALIERVRAQCDYLIVVLISGRPLIISEGLPYIDALVAAWLPGSEAGALAELIFGKATFSGKLSYTWPRSMDQVPTACAKEEGPLFPYGFGLTT